MFLVVGWVLFFSFVRGVSFECVGLEKLFYLFGNGNRCIKRERGKYGIVKR